VTRRGYWLAVVFSSLSSFSYLLWGWHDETMTSWIPYSAVRAQTRADHAAAIGFALARIALTIGFLELLKDEVDK
jgi:hypothetical protein